MSANRIRKRPILPYETSSPWPLPLPPTRLTPKMDPTKSTLQKLKPLIGRKADTLWLRYTAGDREEKGEWLTVINLLAEKYRINPVDDTIILPPPQGEVSKGEIFIGNTLYAEHPSHPFGLHPHELTRHMGLFGSTGTGKTSLAKNLLRRLIEMNIPFIVFDWERTYRDLARENPRVRIFTIGSDTAPFFFNYLKIPPGLHYQDYVKNVIEVLSRAYIGGAGSDSVLLKVFDQAYREQDVPTTNDARNILKGEMSPKKMRGREMLWKQSSLRMLEFLSYGGTGKIYNVQNFYPLEKLQEEFVVFELGALANSNDKRFFVEMFSLYYWLHKEHQGMEDENLKHVIVFEEFHNIVDNSKKDDLVQKMFRQIRKYGTGLVVIDQTPFLIPNPIFENLYSKISFSLNHKRNVDAIASAMNMTLDEQKFIGMLQTGQAIVRLMGRYSRPFMVEVPFEKRALNIPDDEIREHMKDFYKNYSPDMPSFPEIEPLRSPPLQFIPSPLERIYFSDLLAAPFEGADKRAKKLGLIPRDAIRLQNNLVVNGILKPVIIDRKKLFEITPAGIDALDKIGIKVKQDGHQGMEHRYYVEQIRKAYVENGWFSRKEEDGVDLVVEKADLIIAIEVETGLNHSEQLTKNIEKLLRCKADRKWLVATNEVSFAKLSALFAQSNPPGANDVRIAMARDLLKSLPS